MIATALLTTSDHPPLTIQEEPALELAMPRVFRRPAPPPFTRGRAPVAELVRRALEAQRTGAMPRFGEAYGELLVEFQPAIRWALTCWDYLLSTEGCRFVPREMGERQYHRSDYRAATEQDYARLVHRTFKQRLLSYLPAEDGRSFAGYLRQHFWPTLLNHYRRLDQPLDQRQCTLTGFSYLRCAPYRFLNDYHEHLVHEAIKTLPPPERRVIDRYYLRFYTDDAASEDLGVGLEMLAAWKSRALNRLRRRTLLAYYLLLQIERY